MNTRKPRPDLGGKTTRTARLMADLLDGLSRLAATPLPPESRLALSGVMRHARDLEEQLVGSSPQSMALAKTIDRATFDNLLLLAGPGVADELLAQLVDDLTAVLTKLRLSLGKPEWETIRNQTHILMALTGSIGAMRGHSMAQELNQASHDEDHAAVRLAAANVLGEIVVLIDFIKDELSRHRNGGFAGKIR